MNAGESTSLTPPLLPLTLFFCLLLMLLLLVSIQWCNTKSLSLSPLHNLFFTKQQGDPYGYLSIITSCTCPLQAGAAHDFIVVLWAKKTICRVFQKLRFSWGTYRKYMYMLQNKLTIDVGSRKFNWLCTTLIIPLETLSATHQQPSLCLWYIVGSQIIFPWITQFHVPWRESRGRM